MPRKTFDLKQDVIAKVPLTLPEDITVEKALNRVLRLVNVASKRYLTNKVYIIYYVIKYLRESKRTNTKYFGQCLGPLVYIKFTL